MPVVAHSQFKTEEELEVMQYANDVASAAHVQATPFMHSSSSALHWTTQLDLVHGSPDTLACTSRHQLAGPSRMALPRAACQ